MASDLPVPVTPPGQPDGARTALSPVAVERVLARAAELHLESGSDDPSGGIDEQRLLDIAQEVGISVTSVRQALAEERTRVSLDDAPSGWLDKVAGPGTVSATRVIRGTPASVVAALDDWMQREECMRVQRRFADRVVWEPRSDIFGAMKRGLRIGGRSYHLCKTRQLSASVVPMDADNVVVRLDANIAPVRTVKARVGALAVGGGTVATGVIAFAAVISNVTGAFLLPTLIPLGLSGGLAWALMAQQRSFAERTKLELELVLDRFQHSDIRRPANLLDALVGARPLLR